MSKIQQITMAAIMMAVSFGTHNNVQGAPLPPGTVGTVTGGYVEQQLLDTLKLVDVQNGPMRRDLTTTKPKQAQQLERAIQNIFASLPIRKRRDFWDTIGDAFEDTADTVGSGLEDAADYVKNAVDHDISLEFPNVGVGRRSFWDSIASVAEDAASGIEDAADDVGIAVTKTAAVVNDAINEIPFNTLAEINDSLNLNP